jgi:ribosomal protein L37AE/L43A
MKTLMPMVDERKTIEGKQVRVWRGISIRKLDRKDTKDMVLSHSTCASKHSKKNDDDSIHLIGGMAKKGVYPAYGVLSLKNSETETANKNVCDRCGKDTVVTEYNGELLCDDCMTKAMINLERPTTNEPPVAQKDEQETPNKDDSLPTIKTEERTFVCPCGQTFATFEEMCEHQKWCDVFHGVQSREAMLRMQQEEQEKAALDQ